MPGGAERQKERQTERMKEIKKEREREKERKEERKKRERKEKEKEGRRTEEKERKKLHKNGQKVDYNLVVQVRSDAQCPGWELCLTKKWTTAPGPTGEVCSPSRLISESQPTR